MHSVSLPACCASEMWQFFWTVLTSWPMLSMIAASGRCAISIGMSGTFKQSRFVGFWLAIVLLVFGPTLPVYADPPENYPFLSYDDGLKQARAQDKRIFLYFGRLGCGWCDKTNKESFSDPALRALYINHYVLVYADAESGKRLTLPSGERITEMELGARMKAFATPLFVWLESDGKIIAKVAGVQTVKDFRDYDRFVYGGEYRAKNFKQFIAENP